jgi:hypothetical protein
MKSKEEIEQLSDKAINKEGYTTDDFIIGFEQGYTQCQEDMADNSKVTRFEVIDENGRVYTKHNCTIKLSYQDDSRTLKVFIKNKQD